MKRSRSVADSERKRVARFQLARPGGPDGPTHHTFWFRVLCFIEDEQLVLHGWLLAASSSFFARVVKSRLSIFHAWSTPSRACGAPLQTKFINRVLRLCPNLSREARGALIVERGALERTYARLCEQCTVLLARERWRPLPRAELVRQYLNGRQCATYSANEAAEDALHSLVEAAQRWPNQFNAFLPASRAHGLQLSPKLHVGVKLATQLAALNVCIAERSSPGPESAVSE